MSQTESETLNALEHLMEEFYLPSTSNIRKHEIEVQLNHFSGQLQCWKLCVYFLDHTSSQYVLMYALSTIESVINRQWASLEWEQRVQLKTALYRFLVEQDSTCPHLIRNKLAKLIVDIARYDWPHFFPEFFTNILELLQSKDGQLLGLVLLRTASEEFMSARPDLSSVRKEELTKLLQQNIPQIFQILCTILEKLGTKPRHASTATPPPSPTHPSSAPDITQELIAASFRPDNKTIIRESLATIQHIFTWAQLQQVPLSLIKAIFYFTNISSYAQDDDDMCVLAMSTLNELLYRKCAPPGTQNLFTQLYHYVVQLLRDIVCPIYNRLETLGNDFVDKLSELLVLLVEQHLWHLEAEPGFSALDFLSLLFDLTLQLSSLQCYVRCLAVWVAFIKQLKPQNSQKYSEALFELVKAVLNKMQFGYNHGQLEEIQSLYVDDENDTEWDIFLKTSIELLALVAEVSPMKTFNSVIYQWKAANDVYCMLENVVDHRNCVLKIDASEHIRLNYILRDLSSLTETLARLSTLFLDQDNDYYKTSLPIINNLINKFIESACIASNCKFYRLKSRHDSVLIEVHSQILAALKTWSVWLPLNNQISDQHLKQLLTISMPLLIDPTPPPSKICQAAAHLLLSISNTVYPPSLVMYPAILEFIRTAPNLKFSGKHTREIINNAVCNILIRPWGELSQDDTQHRNLLICSYFDALTKDFRELTCHTPEAKVREIVISTLPTLTYIIDHANNLPSQCKKILYGGLKSTIEVALKVFPEYSRYPEVSDHILVLFLSVLSVLQQQLGVDSTKRAVEVFLDVAISQQQSKNLSGLDKLLQILQIVVEAQGSAYKTFLPGILQLCLQHVYPYVICEANEQPDIIIALLTLLHSTLVHRWQYFYMSQVRLGYSPGCSETEAGPDTPQQPDQLLAVLQVFGQALLQPDINTFRTSLFALEDLNNKWKLYNKIFCVIPFGGQARHFFPRLFDLPDTDSILESEERKIVLTHTVSLDWINGLLSRFSSLRKIQGIVAYCLRFVKNSQREVNERETGALTARELYSALCVIVKAIQKETFANEIECIKNGKVCSKPIQKLAPFLDAQHVLRVGARLRHSELPYDAKHPMMLPRKH